MPDQVWTHLSDDQAGGRACVMCGRPTGRPGWAGVVVGRSDVGAPVYACSGEEGHPCAEQAGLVVPDSPEGLGL